jgi:hypothetical protein
MVVEAGGVEPAFADFFYWNDAIFCLFLPVFAAH